MFSFIPAVTSGSGGKWISLMTLQGICHFQSSMMAGKSLKEMRLLQMGTNKYVSSSESWEHRVELLLAYSEKTLSLYLSVCLFIHY